LPVKCTPELEKKYSHLPKFDQEEFSSRTFIMNKEQIKQRLDNYEVKGISEDKEITKQYDFTNYDKLLNLVKQEFPTRRSVKMNLFRILVNTISISSYIPLFYIAMFSNYSLFMKCISSFFAGILWVSIGFNVMHDASHYGVSVNPHINDVLTKMWNSFGLWNSKIWFYHHIYHHHSYTGESKKDPDLYHYKPLFRKRNDENDNKFIKHLCKNQGDVRYVLPIVTIFPGMYYSQAVMYLFSSFKKRLLSFGLPKTSFYDNMDIILMLCNLYCLYNGLFLPTIVYMITVNTVYHINIVADHDTYETSIENHYDGNDWLRIQIQNSGNFLNDSFVWTHMFGAINYQIEHHLFPNMSSVYYPKVKPIVMKYCKENNIPYVHHPTLLGAYKSYMRMLNYNRLVENNRVSGLST
jgi:linoleoyl-CoA desaturase